MYSPWLPIRCERILFSPWGSLSEQAYYMYWVAKLVYQRFFGTQLFLFKISKTIGEIGYQKTSGKLIWQPNKYITVAH